MEPLFGEAFLRRHLGVSRADYIQSRRGNDTWHLPLQELLLKVYSSAHETRFLRELTALHRVRHRSVMALDRWGRVETDRGRVYWLTAAYVPGGTVADAIEDQGWPSPTDFRAFATALLRGLGAMHRAGLVHRDVKPSNIALNRGRWSSPVVLDLGIARFIEADQQHDGQLGTYPYMSPEQLRGEPAVPQSDVFSVGVVAYKLLSKGGHPFAGRGERLESAEAVRRMAAGPSDLTSLPADFASWVQALLQPDAADRPDADTAVALLDA